MKKYISYAITALFAMSTVALAAPDKDTMLAKENSAWQAFKEKKADDFKKVVSSDMVAVYSDGIMNMQAEMDAMGKTTMKSFALSDFNVSAIDDNTVIVTYKSKVESSMGGKDSSGTYNCASVWVMKNGEWKAVFHTDMKAEPAS